MAINDVSTAKREAFARKTQSIHGKFEASIGKDIMELALRNLNAA